MNPLFFLLIYILPSILVGFAGINKKGGFWKAFFISVVLTPLIGILFTVGAAAKFPKGCLHCGNKDNEAEYCGLCGKNEAGKLRYNN